jgi:hypothetical protein
VNKDPASIDKVTIYTATTALEVQQQNGAFYVVPKYPQKGESGLVSKLDGASPSIDHETDTNADAKPGDALASHLSSDNGTVQISQALAVPALLGLVVMMVYVPLQSLRAGLLTRMAGSLGIALGAAALILPYAMIGVVLWIGYIGLLFVGRVPGGRPPAWAAGEAIPWPRPGEAPTASGEQPSPDAIEGSATEVASGEPEAEPGGTERPERRKRKRRR